jgi:outer membrane receptor for ferrienterochelin and colicins
MPRLTYLIWLAVCFLARPAFAQDHSYELERIHINAAGSDGVLSLSPIRTLLISGDEIKKLHAKTLDEALKYTSGVDIKPITKDAENGSGVSIQGLDPSQVLIMVDGNPIPPNAGEMLDVVDIRQVLIGDVERIEIIQGGASAIYGANAMGGVVNIISKNANKPLTLSTDISAGDWGGISSEPASKKNAIVNISGKHGEFSSQLITNLIAQEGFDTDPTVAGSDGWHGYKNNIATKLQHFSDQGNTLTIAPSFYRAKTATYKLSQDIFKTLGEDTVNRSRNTWDVTYQGLYKDLAFKVHAMDQSYNEKIESSTNRLDQNSENQAFNLTLNKHFGYNHLVSLSIEHKYQYLNQYNLAKQKFEVHGKHKRNSDLSISDSWIIGGDIEVLPALRINNDELYGTHVSPMFSAKFTKDIPTINSQINIRSSIANGYKTPTLKEMYWEFDHSTLLRFGNPDLKPEESLNTQLGIEFKTQNGSRLEMNLFNHDIVNLISTEQNPERALELDVATVEEYANVREAQIQGADFSYKKNFDHISFGLGYSYLNAVNLATNKLLPEKPKEKIKLGIDLFGFNNINVSLKYHYQSRQFVDFENTNFVESYEVLDFKFNHRIRKNQTWYFGIDNVFNTSAKTFTTAGAHGQSGNEAISHAPRYAYLGIRFNY